MNSGDRARYRVAPVVELDSHRGIEVGLRSDWTPWVDLSTATADGFSVSFNRGLVISQFMSRYLSDLRRREGLDTTEQALASFKRSLENHETPIRQFLSGVLRTSMLDLLGAAEKQKRDVYAALYELEDSELVGALVALGRRAHVVLANGSITQKKGEKAEVARKRDQNKSARQALRDAGVEVFDRFLSPGALGHNKFLVVTDGQAKASTVWTGSTNWTRTGLCTQINNGILVNDRKIAGEYMAHWQRLADAGSAFPKALTDANKSAKSVKVKKSACEVWFTRSPGGGDLKAIDAVIAGAKEAILFLMFQPGGAGVLKTIRTVRSKAKTLYVKGVVSTLPSDSGSTDDPDSANVEVMGDGLRRRVDLDIVQPQGIKTPFAGWAANVTRDQFLKNVGFAIVHSKLIVVDPFTNPVVVTGSHNFSSAASGKNDENFLIVRGNGTLAREYAAHILGVYQHYRWLTYVNDKQKKGEDPRGSLNESDSWQTWHLRGAAKREIEFWVS